MGWDGAVARLSAFISYRTSHENVNRMVVHVQPAVCHVGMLLPELYGEAWVSFACCRNAVMPVRVG